MDTPNGSLDDVARITSMTINFILLSLMIIQEYVGFIL
jgi:hypothetical protein